MTPRAAARVAWSVWLVATATAVMVVILLVSNDFARAPGQFGPAGMIVVFQIVFGTVGALIASRRPENPIGWLFLATGVVSAVQELANQWAIRAARLEEGLLLWRFAAWIPSWIWLPITLGMACFLFLLFPTGRLLSRRWRAVAWFAAGTIAVTTIAFALLPGRLENFRSVRSPIQLGVDREVVLNVGNAGMGLSVVALALSLAALVVRFRRSTGDERAQMKWLVSSAVFMVVVFAASLFVQIESANVGGLLAVGVIAAFFSIPVATGVAILKYRLYDIDVVISKAVVYAILLGIIALDYLAIVVGIGTLVGNRSSPFLTAVAAGIVAVTFMPINRRLQRFANRLVYGKRATPYEVLSEFAERAAGSYSIDDVLPRMARVLGEGTGAERAEVQLRIGGRLRPEASWPAAAADPEADPDLVVPVTHLGEDLGALAVWKRRGEAVTPVEEKLVRDLAAQAGLVLRNVRLVDELRESRRRLVTAQDAERRRLERDIHDGAQQHLVALAVKLRVLEALIPKDPDRAVRTASEVKAQANDALETLRDLARGIYPPLLADQGLAAALQAQAGKSAVRVEVHPDGVGRYPQEVEAAVYFCVLEALQNVAKYAEATRADLTLRQADGQVEFEVRDDGRGFDPAATPPGSGLTNMRDRLEALGGTLEIRSAPGDGTTVMGRIPVEPRP